MLSAARVLEPRRFHLMEAFAPPSLAVKTVQPLAFGANGGRGKKGRKHKGAVLRCVGATSPGGVGASHAEAVRWCELLTTASALVHRLSVEALPKQRAKQTSSASSSSSSASS